MVAIDLSPELEEFVDQEVASGRYRSRADVIADAVRYLRAQSEFEDELREKIQVGIDELERGEVIRIRSQEEHDALFEGIRQEVRERIDSREQA
jgi:antitoxin ParD1/3/4